MKENTNIIWILPRREKSQFNRYSVSRSIIKIGKWEIHVRKNNNTSTEN